MTIFKSLPLESVELRFEGNTRKFRGYASTFNGNDSYGDTILPGAYLKTLADNGMPKMFFAHDWGLPVGKWLSAVEDEKGLLVEGELTPGNPQSDAILAAMKHGTVDGLSIGFPPVRRRLRAQEGRRPHHQVCLQALRDLHRELPGGRRRSRLRNPLRRDRRTSNHS